MRNVRGAVVGERLVITGTLDLNGWEADQLSGPDGWAVGVVLEADGLPGIDYSIQDWGGFVTYDYKARLVTGEASVKVTPGHLRVAAPTSGLGNHDRFKWFLTVSRNYNVGTWDGYDLYSGDTGQTPGRK